MCSRAAVSQYACVRTARAGHPVLCMDGVRERSVALCGVDVGCGRVSREAVRVAWPLELGS